MSDKPLIPAPDADVLFALSFALRFDERGKHRAFVEGDRATLAARRLLNHLQRSNFVVMQRESVHETYAWTGGVPPGVPPWDGGPK